MTLKYKACGARIVVPIGLASPLFAGTPVVTNVTAQQQAWPGNAPDGASFMGALRARTSLPFDLPTEAQWEYACHAGTTNALNNNTNLQNSGQDPNMNVLGRYNFGFRVSLLTGSSW